MTMTSREGLDAVDLGEELGHDRRLHVGADAGAPRAEEGLHLVEEDDDGHPLVGLLAGPLEDLPDLALRLADVLVQQLGPLDVEEEAAHVVVARLLGHLLGQGVGDRLGDERLAAARGAVEEDPLGGGQRVLGEQVAVHVGQLDGVGDGLDLCVEPADVGVGDVGHLLEDELLALELGQLLDEELRAHVHQERVAGPQLGAHHVLGELRHPLLVGPGVDDAAPPVLELLLQRDDLAGELAVADEDDVEALVEDDLVALADLSRVDVGVQTHPHLAAAREDVDRAVVVDAEERAVGRRGLGELLDLFTQRGQLLLGLLEGEGQLLVLRGGLGQLALGLEQPLLEGLHPARALLQPPAERVDLILGVCQLGAQRLGLGSGFVWSRGHCMSP